MEKNSTSYDAIRRALSDSLDQFAVTDLERTVYEACMVLGTKPVSSIAKKAGLNRAHTYDILSGLVAKGLVRQSTRNDVKHFSCTSAERLVSLLESRERELASKKDAVSKLLPLLRKLKSSIDPEVEFNTGRSAIRRLLEEILTQQGGVLFAFANPSHSVMLDHERSDFTPFHESRRSKNIWLHTIVSSTALVTHPVSEDKERKQYVKRAQLPDLPVEILVHGETVSILSSRDLPFVIHLRHKAVAQSLQSIHMGLWSLSVSVAWEATGAGKEGALAKAG